MVQDIRSNQQIEQDLDVMDIKIGLLVKNRISLQDVLSTSQQVRHKDKKGHRQSQILDQPGMGVGGLSKANHEKIEVCLSGDIVVNVVFCCCYFFIFFIFLLVAGR